MKYDPVAVLSDPTVSFWLQDALRAAINRDPVDVLSDAEYLVQILKARLNALQETHEKAITPASEMVADIRHSMEMYPQAEVDCIVRAVNAHEEMLTTLKSINLRDVDFKARERIMQAIAKAEARV